MQGLKDHMKAFAHRFILLTSMLTIEFKTVFLKVMDKFIPSKMTKGKLGYPWIDARIRTLVRKREKKCTIKLVGLMTIA